MSAPSPTAAAVRFAIYAIAGATALSVAACGTSNKGTAPTSPAASPTTSSPAAGKGKDRVSGLITSVSGSTIQVSQSSGTATVEFTTSTKVSEITPAQLSDVTTGSCVSVRPTPGSASGGSAITARSVRISAPADGKCPYPKQPARADSTAPSPTAPVPDVAGAVAAITGNNITVTNSGGGNQSQTTVTVTDTTTYTKQATTDGHAIAQGKCIAARGTKDTSGVLQATTITLQPATDGTCPQPGGNHHGR